MKIIPLKWQRIKISPEDTKDEITRKLAGIGLSRGHYAGSTYVIRLSKTFIVEYENNKMSPVVYIGEGNILDRLHNHLGWLTKLAESLPGTTVEVKISFPRMPDGSRAHEEFESHLLRNFKQKFGTFPLKNRISGVKHQPIDFSKEKTAQILGHGTGKSYAWSIRPLKVSFLKKKSR